MLPRKKRARRMATAQDSGDTSKTGAKGSDRRRTYLEVIDSESESEQQNDVDKTSAGVGGEWSSDSCVWCFCGNGDWRREEGSRRGQTWYGEDPGGFDSVGLWSDMKEVRDKLTQEMSRAKKASELQHLANDIEGKATWVSREARRLNELEADIAKLQAHLT